MIQLYGEFKFLVMEKKSRAQLDVGCIYLSIHKLQRLEVGEWISKFIPRFIMDAITY